MEPNRLLRGLPAGELEWLQPLFKHRTYLAGTRLISAGDSCEFIYLLDGGRVRLSRRIGPTQTSFLGELGPGHFFGEIGVLDGQPSLDDAVAITDVNVRMLAQTDLLEVLSHERPAARHLLRNLVTVLVRRSREMDERFANYAGKIGLLQHYNSH